MNADTRDRLAPATVAFIRGIVSTALIERGVPFADARWVLQELDAALAPTTPESREVEPCGATHPNGRTHCRQDRGHSGPHATARRDPGCAALVRHVVWVDDFDFERFA